jgi:hypothetical protein
MRRILSATLLATCLWSGAAAAEPAKAAKAAISPAAPESAILIPVQLLRANDFKGFFDAMPAADQAKANAEWEANRTKQGPDAQGLAEANQFLAKLLKPDAGEALMAEAAPKLKEMNPQEISQGLQMMGMMLSMAAMQPAKGEKPDPAKQAMATTIGGLCNDASQWVLTAGIEDPIKCRKAIDRLVAGAKALNVTDIKELQALPLDQFLARLSPLVKELKAAAAIYDVQIDAFLDSVSAKPGAAKNGATTLTVAFTAFGKPYSLPVEVEQKDGHWVMKQNPANPLKGMMGPVEMGGGPEPMPLDNVQPAPTRPKN